MVLENANGSVEESAQNGTLVGSSWLNEEYFEDVLQNEFGDCKIMKFKATYAVPKGENYASMMSRVSIEIKLKDDTTKNVNYIVKSMLESKFSSSFSADLAIFPKEIEMYEKVVPNFNEMFKKAGVDFGIGAKCVKTSMSPPVIVMEDLKVKGYENINRLEGMDKKHMEATLAKLAMFHAASARLYEIKGPYSEHFNKGTIPPEFEPIMDKLMLDFWPIMEDCMMKWGDCEKYVAGMKKVMHTFTKRIQESEKIDPTELNVLNHGDMWCNNIMFKHNHDGDIEDVKFVDLQMCRWGSPVLDLQYLIVSSSSYDIRLSKFDYFIKFYYDHLVKNLKLVKFSGKVPRLLDLHIQLLKRGYFGVNVTFGVMSAVLLDPNDKADMENFFESTDESTEFKKQMLSTPRYVKAVKSLLPFFENKGILEF